MHQILYHGSDHVIERPQFGYGKSYNDYGLGFYCTDTLEMAKEWGVGMEHDGYANRYELDDSGLVTLDLNDGQFCILHWLAVLLENRQFEVHSGLALEAKQFLGEYFSVDYHEADLMIGYRADDSYFSFAQDFINGAISYRQLNNAMHLGKLGQQIVLKSKKAFEHLTFLDSEMASSDEWYAKKMLRDKSARRQYFDAECSKRQKGDLYITQIMDEEMKPNDPRLR